MIEEVVLKLKDIYQTVMESQIDENEFMQGNLIEKFHIDSLIALQIIVEIEKRFDFIIEEDETAIKIVDSPTFFLSAYKGLMSHES